MKVSISYIEIARRNAKRAEQKWQNCTIALREAKKNLEKAENFLEQVEREVDNEENIN